MEPTVDGTMHAIDLKLCATSQEEMMVWAYIMTQYNLKPGLRKFGARGATAAVKELTQLHIIDTWTRWRSASYPESNKCAHSRCSCYSRKSAQEMLRVEHA